MKKDDIKRLVDNKKAKWQKPPVACLSSKKGEKKKENEGLKLNYVCIHRKPTLESPLWRVFLILLSLFFFFLLLLFFIHSAF